MGGWGGGDNIHTFAWGGERTDVCVPKLVVDSTNCLVEGCRYSYTVIQLEQERRERGYPPTSPCTKQLTATICDRIWEKGPLRANYQFPVWAQIFAHLVLYSIQISNFKRAYLTNRSSYKLQTSLLTALSYSVTAPKSRFRSKWALFSNPITFMCMGIN